MKTCPKNAISFLILILFFPAICLAQDQTAKKIDPPNQPQTWIVPAFEKNQDGQEIRSERELAALTIKLGDMPGLVISTQVESKTIDFPTAMLEKGDFFVSDDGNWIVWSLKRAFPTLPEMDTPAIAFYKKGELIKKYSISEMIERGDLLPQSNGLTYWLFQPVGVNFERRKATLVSEDYFEHHFDTRSGELTYHDYIQSYKEARYIVEGEFDMPSKEIGWRILPAGRPIKMKVFNWVKGEGPDEISVEKTFSWGVCQPRFKEMFELDKKSGKWILQGNFCPR